MPDLIAQLAASARSVPESGIVKVFNYGRTREGLIALWAGEGDTPTPEPIRTGARAALDEGQTFYTYQRGIPALARGNRGLYLAALWPAGPGRGLFRHLRRNAGNPDGRAARGRRGR